jgi:hypothetical protein
VRERLKSRWLGIRIPSHPDELVVDVHHGATRLFLEHALADTLADLGYATLKIGDLVGSNRQISRAASRLFYDAKLNGVRSRSAEHAPSEAVALFETHPVSGHVRVALIQGSAHLVSRSGRVSLGAFGSERCPGGLIPCSQLLLMLSATSGQLVTPRSDKPGIAARPRRHGDATKESRRASAG